jgi:hypothetical protein
VKETQELQNDHSRRSLDEVSEDKGPNKQSFHSTTANFQQKEEMKANPTSTQPQESELGDEATQKPLADQDELQEKCIICVEKEPDCVMEPCGHCNYCEGCLLRAVKSERRCPVCRKVS